MQRGLARGSVPAIAVLLVALLFAGCEKVPEPEGPDDSLLIGAIMLEARGYKETANMRIDGEHYRNITLTFSNAITGEEYELKTREAGLFWSNKIPAGNYYIKRYAFVLETDSHKYTLHGTLTGKLTLPVRPGRVTNLGAILWYSDAENEVYQFRQAKTPEQFRDELQKEFPESAWHQREWISVKI
ncbi:MAG: hypothetical protein GX894_00960 [Clostridia bacterium]|nr:hypothetical protein [Clostridia bacterium]